MPRCLPQTGLLRITPPREGRLRAFTADSDGLAYPYGERDRPGTERGPNKRRVTVAEAAEILGITAEASEPRATSPGAQEGVRGPWWRRVFGR